MYRYAVFHPSLENALPLFCLLRAGALPRPSELEERIEPPPYPRLESVGAPHTGPPPQLLLRRHSGEERLHPHRLGGWIGAAMIGDGVGDADTDVNAAFGGGDDNS